MLNHRVVRGVLVHAGIDTGAADGCSLLDQRYRAAK